MSESPLAMPKDLVLEYLVTSCTPGQLWTKEITEIHENLFKYISIPNIKDFLVEFQFLHFFDLLKIENTTVSLILKPSASVFYHNVGFQLFESIKNDTGLLYSYIVGLRKTPNKDNVASLYLIISDLNSYVISRLLNFRDGGKEFIDTTKNKLEQSLEEIGSIPNNADVAELSQMHLIARLLLNRVINIDFHSDK